MALTVNYGGVAQPDVADCYIGGVYYRLYCWTDYESNAIGTACYVMHDQGQWEVLWHRKMVTVSGKDWHYRPQVMITRSGNAVLYFVTEETGVTYELQPATLNLLTLDSTATWSLSTAIALSSKALYSVEMIRESNNWAMAYENTSNNIICQVRSGVLTTVWSETQTEVPVRCLGVHCHSATGTFLVSYDESGLGRVRTHRRDAADGANPATVTTMYTASTETYRLGHCYYSDTVSVLVTEVRATTDPSDYRGVAWRLITNSTASPPDALHLTPWLTMLSRPFNWKSGKTYCLVAYKSRLADPNEWSQSNAFFADLHTEYNTTSNVNIALTPVANCMQGDAVSVYAQDNHLSHASYHAPYGPALRTRTVAALRWTRITKENGRLTPNQPRVVGQQFHLQDPWLNETGGYTRSVGVSDDTYFSDGPYPFTQFQNVQAGRGLAIGAATPLMFDGIRFVELGFSWWPEILSLTNGSGGALTAGAVYQYSAIYEWTDNRGQMHRSAPSVPVATTLGGSENFVLVKGTMQCLTNKLTEFETSHQIIVKLYRTQANGSIFYAATSYDAPIANDSSAFIWSHSDAMSDANLIKNEIMPHQLDAGGNWTPLENYQPPAANACAVWKNRLFLAGLDNQIWYSHEILPDAGGLIEAAPEFNPINVVRVDDGGPVVAMASLDYALAVFEVDRIHLLYGEGNDRTGAGGRFDKKRIGVGIGCVSPRSVAVSSQGVFFQSEKGVYLLTRNEELTYVGSPVEDLVRSSGNILAAVVNDDNHQLRLLVHAVDGSFDYVLVYDYLFDLWMYWELPGSGTAAGKVVHAIQWRGYKADDPIAILRESGDILLERFDATPWKDGNTGELAETAITQAIETNWLNFANLDGWVRCRSILVHTQRKNTCTVTLKLAYDHRAFESQDEVQVTLSADTPVRVYPRIEQFSALKIQVSDEDEAGLTENYSISGLTFELREKTRHRQIADIYVGA